MRQPAETTKGSVTSEREREAPTPGNSRRCSQSDLGASAEGSALLISLVGGVPELDVPSYELGAVQVARIELQGDVSHVSDV